MTDFSIDQDRRQTRAGVAIVLALVVSLTVLASVSKETVAPYLWLTALVFLAPIPVALLFRKEMASVAVWLYIAAVLVVLVAAVLFGV